MKPMAEHQKPRLIDLIWLSRLINAAPPVGRSEPSRFVLVDRPCRSPFAPRVRRQERVRRRRYAGDASASRACAGDAAAAFCSRGRGRQGAAVRPRSRPARWRRGTQGRGGAGSAARLQASCDASSGIRRSDQNAGEFRREWVELDAAHVFGRMPGIWRCRRGPRVEVPCWLASSATSAR